MTSKLLETPTEHLDALESVVSGVALIREQISSLQAAESFLLHTGNLIAEAIAVAGDHPDHGEMAHRMVAADIGAAVHESDRVVAMKMGRASTLTDEYPEVFASLAQGRISLAHATVITEAGLVINNSANRSKYSKAALEYAETETLGRLRPVAKQLAEQFAENTREERHEHARTCRMVTVVEADDGMATLIAMLPAVYAYGIKDRLDQAAHHIKTNVRKLGERDDARKIDEIRADLLTDLLLAGDLSRVAQMEVTGVTSVRARVQMVVPVNQLTPATGSQNSTSPSSGTHAEGFPSNTLGASPATLAGYGPIDTASARLIASQTPSWEQINVTAETGVVLSVETYRPNAELKRFLGARDLHCRFPGCRIPLRKCDIDHTVDAARGGPTSSTNLAHTCRRHHTMKHATPWSVTQDDTGVLTWVSPTGRIHRDRPASRVRFRSTPGLADDKSAGERTAANTRLGNVF